MNLQDISTSFFFWGKRRYVQGSHIFEAALDAIKHWKGSNIDQLDVSFPHETARQGRFILFSSKDDFTNQKNTLNVHIRGASEGTSFYAGLLCDGEPVSRTIQDDESELLIMTTTDTGSLTISTEYPCKERIFTQLVAMNKALLHATLQNEGFSSWRLARLAIFNPTTIGTDGIHSVAVTNNINGLMTRSRITIDGNSVGEIHFSRGKI